MKYALKYIKRMYVFNLFYLYKLNEFHFFCNPGLGAFWYFPSCPPTSWIPHNTPS